MFVSFMGCGTNTELVGRGLVRAYLIDARRDSWGSDKDDVRGKLRCAQDLQGLMENTC